MKLSVILLLVASVSAIRMNQRLIEDPTETSLSGEGSASGSGSASGGDELSDTDDLTGTDADDVTTPDGTKIEPPKVPNVKEMNKTAAL